MSEGSALQQTLNSKAFEGKKAEGTLTMSANDMDHARSTYDGFMGALKWAIPLIAIITFIVVALIAP